MRPADEIERLVKEMSFGAGSEMDSDLRAATAKACGQSDRTTPALSRMSTRRLIMKNSMIILAAAVVIVAVVIGLVNLIDGEGSGGVVWADVAMRVQTSPGLIYRGRASNSMNLSLEGDNGPDHSMNYLTDKHWRTDDYKDGEIIRTFYRNYETGYAHAVFVTAKRYMREALSEESTRLHKEQTNPKWLMQSIMACEHKELGTKTIDGVLCEGLDTTDPAYFGSELPPEIKVVEAHLRLWVSVETQLPVLFEGKRALEFEGNVNKSELQLDQFEWDIELEASMFEPKIPEDFENIGR
jgi:hypothetical protein